ncbi:hypothetical protein PanWU01x14_149340 [Parasponia andersonii]|uniref:Uncharacterized protein n=1 Tax=Parasponia andersonii TaxID=3476 RepID=A0A2P5CIT0_PARAD|nr:hypothetical protein PanWU01x14_149340 [Parasponia andersonii]
MWYLMKVSFFSLLAFYMGLELIPILVVVTQHVQLDVPQFLFITADTPADIADSHDFTDHMSTGSSELARDISPENMNVQDLHIPHDNSRSNPRVSIANSIVHTMHRLPANNIHSMHTRSKFGVFKPK